MQLTPQSDTLVVREVGGLTATALDSAGRAISGKTATWQSSDSSLATVTGGAVTALAMGVVTITATIDGKSASASLVLEPVVLIARRMPSLLAGDTTQLTATLVDVAGAPLTGAVQWTSANGAVATVTPNGVVTGHSPGLVRVAAGASGAQSAVDVVVLDPSPHSPRGLTAARGATRFDGFGITEVGLLQPFGAFTRISEVEENVADQAWSPDGNHLAVNYIPGSFGPGPIYGKNGLHILDVSGGPSRLVFAGDGRAPAWSPDGTRITFLAGGATFTGLAIHAINADGTGDRTLTNGNADDRAPHWSPDGRRIQWRRGDLCGDVWVMDADGSHQEQLTLPFAARDVAWSPDGKRLAVTSCTFTGGALTALGVWLVNDDGSGLVPLSPNCTAPSSCIAPGYAEAAWRPDGKRLAMLGPNSNGAVFLINADGTAPQMILIPFTCCGGASALTWAPDGQQVAFNTSVFNPSLGLNLSAIALMPADGSAFAVASPAAVAVPYGGVAWRR